MKKHKIFVLGDSISIQYGPYLKDMLEDEFEYDRKRGLEQALADLDKPVGANGGDSRQVLEYLTEEYKKGTKYELLLVNCGLHDLRVNNASGDYQIDVEEYKSNMKQIASIAIKMSENTIWVESTPIIDEIHNSFSNEMSRYGKDVIAYNEAANTIMEANGIPVVGLHDFTEKLGAEAFYDHAHFTVEARKLQAAFIARYIEHSVLRG